VPAVAAAAATTTTAEAPPRVQSSDDDAPPPFQLILARQLSERTGALQMVGLGGYRDQLVGMGLTSIQDFVRIGEDELEALGMSPLQRACFEALRKEVAGQQQQQQQQQQQHQRRTTLQKLQRDSETKVRRGQRAVVRWVGRGLVLPGRCCQRVIASPTRSTLSKTQAPDHSPPHAPPIPACDERTRRRRRHPFVGSARTTR
jgi:hypothetical protein